MLAGEILNPSNTRCAIGHKILGTVFPMWYRTGLPCGLLWDIELHFKGTWLHDKKLLRKYCRTIAYHMLAGSSGDQGIWTWCTSMPKEREVY